jgi:biotin synthase-like enzyme
METAVTTSFSLMARRIVNTSGGMDAAPCRSAGMQQGSELKVWEDLTVAHSTGQQESERSCFAWVFADAVEDDGLNTTSSATYLGLFSSSGQVIVIGLHACLLFFYR